MHHLALALLAAGTAAGTAAAQSTSVTSFLNLDFDNTPVASVVGSTSGFVTLSLTCAADDTDDCGIPPGLLMTQGPSSQRYAYSDDTDQISLMEDCTLTGTTAAYCTVSAGGAGDSDPGVQSAALSGTDISYSPMTITAGLDMLAATGAKATSTGASATGASSAASTGSSGSAKASSTASKTSSASGSSTASAATQSSTGAAAHFAAPLVGVAGVLAAALAL